MDLLQTQGVDGAHHLDERPTKAIKLPHYKHVIGKQVSERCVELRPLGAGLAGLLLLKRCARIPPWSGVALKVEVLIEGGDPGISDEMSG